MDPINGNNHCLTGMYGFLFIPRHKMRENQMRSDTEFQIAFCADP